MCVHVYVHTYNFLNCMRTPRTDPISVLSFFLPISFSMGCFIVSAFPIKGHIAQKFITVVGTKAQVSKDT